MQSAVVCVNVCQMQLCVFLFSAFNHAHHYYYFYCSSTTILLFSFIINGIPFRMCQHTRSSIQREFRPKFVPRHGCMYVRLECTG